LESEEEQRLIKKGTIQNSTQKIEKDLAGGPRGPWPTQKFDKKS
jgi:hypothetical protein